MSAALSFTNSAQLWLRNWSLQVGTGGGQIDLSNLHFTFKITKPIQGSPWTLEAHIWNVGKNELQQISEQFTGVTLSAGYMPPSNQYGLIFDGPATYYKYGRENATDSYIEVNAMNSDPDINAKTVNTTLPQGHTHKDVLQACADAMGVQLGYVSDLGSQQMPRSRVLFGMARDPVRDICQTYNAAYHIDDHGKLNVIKQEDTLQGSVFTLNSHSGLIGVPTQTMGGGVEIRSLLNPAFLPGGTVQVDQSTISRIGAGQGSVALPSTMLQVQGTAAVASDGYYKIVSLTHSGDNRGNSWYTDLVCQSANPNENQGLPGYQAPTLGR